MKQALLTLLLALAVCTLAAAQYTPTDLENTLILETTKGRIVIAVRPDLAASIHRGATRPAQVARFAAW
jgi:hypothetical protein